MSVYIGITNNSLFRKEITMPIPLYDIGICRYIPIFLERFVTIGRNKMLHLSISVTFLKELLVFPKTFLYTGNIRQFCFCEIALYGFLYKEPEKKLPYCIRLGVCVMERVEEIIAEIRSLPDGGCGHYAELAENVGYTLQTIAEAILSDIKNNIAVDDACGNNTHYNAHDAWWENARKLNCSRYMFNRLSMPDDNEYERHCGLTAQRCFRIFDVATQEFVTDRHSDKNRVGESMLNYLCRISKLVENIKYGWKRRAEKR